MKIKLKIANGDEVEFEKNDIKYFTIDKNIILHMKVTHEQVILHSEYTPEQIRKLLKINNNFS